MFGVFGPNKITAAVLMKIMVVVFLCSLSSLEAQTKNKFYAHTYSHVVFAQIDGDQASGYNKLGYSIGVSSGLNLQNSKISALEFHLGIAERGSRRPPNIDDPSINPFHIRYQAFESGLGLVLPIKSLPLPEQLDVYVGLRPYLLFNVEDVEAYMPSIEADMRKFGSMLEIGVRYPLHPKWLLVSSAFYSVTSISKGSSNSSMFYPLGNGAYHNNISLGLIYRP